MRLLLGMLLSAGSTLAFASAEPPRPRLLLVGGDLELCGSRAPEACAGQNFPMGNDLALSYRIDADGIERLKQGWLAQRESARDAVLTSLAELLEQRGASTLDREALATAIGSAWDALASFERDRVLDALEVPAAPERGSLKATSDASTVAILNEFAEMGRKISLRGRPRILVVTASSRDPFASAEFYNQAFSETDAKVLWLPLDAAARAAQQNPAVDCERLDAIRLDLGAAGDRARVFPMRTEQVKSACLNPQMWIDLLLWTDSVFFNGGDQSLTRAAWFQADGSPSAELKLLRQRLAAGQIVVGGTSAGAAVQAFAAGMIVSGQDAIAAPAKATRDQPPRLGCSAANVCNQNEFALLYHPDGGLNTFELGVVDTHFSERGREWRLARLLLDAKLPMGLGIDETTAVRLDKTDKGYRAEVIGDGAATVIQRTGKTQVVLRRFATGATFELPIGDKPGRCNGNPRDGIDIAVDASELRDALQRAGGEAAPTPFRIGGVAAGQACGKDGRVIWTF